MVSQKRTLCPRWHCLRPRNVLTRTPGIITIVTDEHVIGTYINAVCQTHKNAMTAQIKDKNYFIVTYSLSPTIVMI